jgi:hypothetical protein
MKSVKDQVWRKVRVKAYGQIGRKVLDKVEEPVWDQVMIQVYRQVYVQVSRKVLDKARS